MEHKVFTTQIAGRTLTVETGKYAQQANGTCLVRCGDTAVLVTATASKEAREGIDFFPLSVEFEEKMYSVGKIPGGFIKREGRPSEKAILTSRLIDRPIRPLFPKGYYNDVQVVCTVLSVDTDIPPAVYGMIGSSIALSISDIPFAGPTASVAVGMVDGEFVLNPDGKQREKSVLDLTVSGTRDAVMMVEAGANEVTEDEMLSAILYAHDEIKKIIEFIDGIVAETGKPKMDVKLYHVDDTLAAKVREYAFDKIAYSVDTFERKVREQRTEEVTADVQAHFAEEYPDSKADIESVLYDLRKEIVRDRIINKGLRPDGRAMNEIRPIWCEVGVFARTHGSAVFTRGQTQAMTLTTLGAISDAQRLDGLTEGEGVQAVHAPLQHAALLHRRSKNDALHQPQGSGPRGARGARAAARAARRDGIPLRDPHGVRVHQLQRLHLSGKHLREHAFPHGRGRADQRSGGGLRDGPHQRPE
jgi:polyribonucleotide nucleotidyltransferase